MDFVSPENVDECIKLTGEFRRLPSHHKAKEDKLEVGYHMFQCPAYDILLFNMTTNHQSNLMPSD